MSSQPQARGKRDGFNIATLARLKGLMTLLPEGSANQFRQGFPQVLSQEILPLLVKETSGSRIYIRRAPVGSHADDTLVEIFKERKQVVVRRGVSLIGKGRGRVHLSSCKYPSGEGLINKD